MVRMTRRARVLSLLVLASVSATSGIATAASDVASTVDWPQFLSRSDLIWTTMPTSWNNGAFTGNGVLGDILWQDGTTSLRFEINRTDQYDHRSSDMYFGNCRLPNGHFSLTYTGTSPSGRLQLDLWNAEVRGTVTTSNGSITLRTFTHALRNVGIVEITATGGESTSAWRWNPDISKSSAENPPAGYTAYPAQVRETISTVTVSTQDIANGQYATAWKVIDLGSGHRVVYLSEEYSTPGATAKQAAVDAVNAAINDGLPSLEASHRQWWHDFYAKSFLSLPTSKIESFYWIQMYKMASASRANRPLVDLLGPWYTPTKWPGIWFNLNTELTYSPFPVSNHSDVGASLIDQLWAKRGTLAANSGSYSYDSYSIGRSSGTELVRSPGTEVANLAYTLDDVWEQYRYTMDDEMLRSRLFPLMKGAFRYLQHLLKTGTDGKRHLLGTGSPEYTSSVDDCSYSYALLRWIAKNVIYANDRLQLGDPVHAECQNVLASLAPYQVDATGFMVGKALPLTSSHRHWSHLVMIYPLFEYTYDTPSQVSLINTSVNHWLGMTSSWRGFSWFGAASMCAMTGRGNDALRHLNGFLNATSGYYPQPNTLYREGGPVIETPLFGARSIQDMLLMSYNNTIRVFPGVPDAWPNVEFDRLRAEGAFLVSAKRQSGVTRFVRIESLAGEPCKVKLGGSGTVQAYGNRAFNVVELGNGVVQVDLARGEWVVLYSGASLPALTLGPVAVTDNTNYWGTISSTQKPTPSPTGTPAATPTSTPTPTQTPTPTPSGAWIEITPAAAGVTDSTNDGNVPGNTVDGSLATRWSGNGDGAWIRYDLGATRSLARVTIAVYRGNERRNRFDLERSLDGVTWTAILAGAETSGTTLAEEPFDFAPADARYVRYVGHMSNVGTFNSLTEVSVFSPGGSGATPTPTAVPTSTPTSTPSLTPTPTATPGGGLSGYYKMIARHSGKAVAVQGASTADGANVVQWTYGGAETNDEWELRGIGSGYYRIVNRSSGKDMVVQGASTANGANVFQYTYGGTATNDEWQPVDLGNGYFRIVNRNSGKVLDVSAAGTADGANVDQWSWVTANQEMFQLVGVP